MCTLWQRLGRGARDRNTVAIGLILVEHGYYDKPPQPPKKRRRQADDPPANEAPCAKRRKGSDAAVLRDSTLQNAESSDEEDEPVVIDTRTEEQKAADLHQMLEARRIQYATEARERKKHKDDNRDTWKKQKGSIPLAEMPTEMMDLINADSRGIGCRRTPVRLFFSFDQASELGLPY